MSPLLLLPLLLLLGPSRWRQGSCEEEERWHAMQSSGLGGRRRRRQWEGQRQGPRLPLWQ